jgi:hypothetical protein
MNTSELIAAIDAEISRLQEARELLVLMALRESMEPSRQAKRKNVMSPEARARISAAQKKRWAQQKRAAKQ